MVTLFNWFFMKRSKNFIKCIFTHILQLVWRCDKFNENLLHKKPFCIQNYDLLSITSMTVFKQNLNTFSCTFCLYFCTHYAMYSTALLSSIYFFFLFEMLLVFVLLRVFFLRLIIMSIFVVDFRWYAFWVIWPITTMDQSIKKIVPGDNIICKHSNIYLSLFQAKYLHLIPFWMKEKAHRDLNDVRAFPDRVIVNIDGVW